MKANQGFTLVEMLVVIGIIAILTAASIASFSRMTRSAENAKARELVMNTATALSSLYQNEGAWPKRILTANAGDNLLDAQAALPLADYMSLKTKEIEDNKKELAGLDRFGIVDIWGAAVLKRRGDSASEGEVKNRILYFAVDDDDDGIVEIAKLGHLKVRASAVVWGAGKDGKMAESYYDGIKQDDIYSWTSGMVEK